MPHVHHAHSQTTPRRQKEPKWQTRRFETNRRSIREMLEEKLIREGI